MIGYLALARETFDVEFAESKFRQAKDLFGVYIIRNNWL